MTKREVVWCGKIGEKDDFGEEIRDVFVDGATGMGPWGIMTPLSHLRHGVGLGLGRGQMYRKQPDGRWLKVQG